jgi:hypothetical protein
MFDAVISLGGVCQPAEHAKRFFLGRKNSSPFDFTVTPLRGVISTLLDDGARLGQDFQVIAGGTNTLCENYGIMYHHEFERQDGLIRFSAERARACGEKLRHKYASMIEAASSGTPLFVRLGASTDAPGDELRRRALNSDDLTALEDVLADKLGHGNFHVAFIDMRGIAWGIRYDDLIEVDRIPPRTSLHIRNVTPDESMDGGSEFWDDFFHSFGLQPDQSLVGVSREAEALHNGFISAVSLSSGS